MCDVMLIQYLDEIFSRPIQVWKINLFSGYKVYTIISKKNEVCIHVYTHSKDLLHNILE